MSGHNIFPKWSNKLPAFILAGLLGAGSVVVVIFWYWFSPANLNVGYQPKQPIPYSHRLHAGELGIDCRYCHTGVEKSPTAGIPPTETCMNCHKLIKKNSPHIIKLRESFSKNVPIEWVRVHQLPDYAYFDHSRHINSGVSCVSCHGRIDQMETVRQVKPLSMGWCLDCHRDPVPHLRPKSEVTNMDWVTPSNQEEEGLKLKALYHVNPREDCTTCHR
ncbi:cytochrome c3 family protein [bacterium]|jgi:menaquinone reductase, multiheme cytochrome c subunit|nr:cytochrome c3 family protein [bacterium]